VKLQMPVFTLLELLSIGKRLLGDGCVPEELTKKYSPKQIERRFHQFGGILRHVLPLSVVCLAMCLDNQKEAIDSCDARALLVSGNIERKDISHFIMQYIVKTDGKLPFVEYSLDFVNKQVTTKIQNKLSACSLEERRVALIRNDKTKMFMKEACPKIYESVIADLLTWIDGVKWKTRVAPLRSSEGRKLVVFQVTRQTKNSKLFDGQL
jgi:hypothetical protein